MYETTFSVDRFRARIAVGDAVEKAVRIVGSKDWGLEQVIHTPASVFLLQWLPSSNAFVFGTPTGELFRADGSDGRARKLAQVYAPGRGLVDGLAVSRDGTAVAVFNASGPAFRGTSVEVRSAGNGSLISSMPGPAGFRPSEIAWDLQDRFIVCSGRNTLVLWDWRNDSLAVMTYGEPGSAGRFALSDDGAALALIDHGSLRMFRLEDQQLTR